MKILKEELHLTAQHLNCHSDGDFLLDSEALPGPTVEASPSVTFRSPFSFSQIEL